MEQLGLIQRLLFETELVMDSSFLRREEEGILNLENSARALKARPQRHEASGGATGADQNTAKLISTSP